MECVFNGVAEMADARDELRAMLSLNLFAFQSPLVSLI